MEKRLTLQELIDFLIEIPKEKREKYIAYVDIGRGNNKDDLSYNNDDDCDDIVIWA